MLLTVKIAVGIGSSAEHLLRRAIAADLVDRGPEDEVFAKRNARGRESLLVAPQPLASGGGIVRVGQMRDVAVADRNQVLRQAAGAGTAVADDQVALGLGQRTVEEDEREAAPEQREDAVARIVVSRREQQPLDAVGNEVLDIFALEPEVALAVAEKHAIAGAPRGRLGTAHHRREEWVDHVGDDQPDRLGLPRDQAASDAVRHIVEFRDRLLDPPLRFRVDAVPPVDHARDGHRRDPRPLSHIAQCDDHERLLLANKSGIVRISNNSLQ